MEIHQRLIGFANEFRRSLLTLAGLIVGTTVGLYCITPTIFAILQTHLHQPLAFFTVAEPFLAHVKLAFFSALFVLMPLLLLFTWRALARPFRLSGTQVTVFTVATCGLFYFGASFCYLVTLPFGVNFLIGFGSEHLKPVISIDSFVSFVSLFVLAFGLIFELPVFMVFCTMAGICPRANFEKHRRYAILVISIAAALLTPTPDIVNMALMGGPLYLLYESGILALRLMGRP